MCEAGAISFNDISYEPKNTKFIEEYIRPRKGRAGDVTAGELNALYLSKAFGEDLENIPYFHGEYIPN